MRLMLEYDFRQENDTIKYLHRAGQGSAALLMGLMNSNCLLHRQKDTDLMTMNAVTTVLVEQTLI